MCRVTEVLSLNFIRLRISVQICKLAIEIGISLKDGNISYKGLNHTCETSVFFSF